MFENSETKKAAFIAVLFLIVGGLAGAFLTSSQSSVTKPACELKTGEGAYIFTTDENMTSETCFEDFLKYNPAAHSGGCVYGKQLEFQDTNQGFGLYNESMCVCFPD